MNRIYFYTMFLVTLFCVGCLNFGDDSITTDPSLAQLKRCRNEMYINPQVKITPLGLKILGSGIDDAMWFKFQTNETKFENIFNGKFIDAKNFGKKMTLTKPDNSPSWWDIHAKRLTGGSMSLPGGKHISIYSTANPAGLLIYVVWFET